MMPPIAAPFPPPATADDRADGRTDARAVESLRGLVVALRASFIVNLDCVAIQGLDSHEISGEPVRDSRAPWPGEIESGHRSALQQLEDLSASRGGSELVASRIANLKGFYRWRSLDHCRQDLQ